MRIITLDFETFYSADIGFAKQTTEEYIRDPQFHVIGVAVKVGDAETEWFSGTMEETKEWLECFPWNNHIAVAHNALFDMAILNWHFGIKPFAIADTLSMARALHGTEVGNSLGKLATHYELGVKGTEVVNAKGLRRTDFDDAALAKYGDYCVNDVELTYDLFNILLPNFAKIELRLIDLTIRMFTEPVLRLDTGILKQHAIEVRNRKEELLASAGATVDDLMSNPKFAELLRGLGVEPPTKISLTTGKETLALAKGDEEFKALAEHPDERVQALVAARLGNKSTLEETRTDRFLSIASRGPLPVPLSYYGAHTGRWGGADKINLQNLPSRGDNAGKLKSSILAPSGYVMIDCDSSQIEARVLAWFAGQQDLVEVFEKNNAEIAAGIKKGDMKFDPYKLMAAQIYGKDPGQISDAERFVGKTTILGSGYGMGAARFQAQLKLFNVEIDLKECSRIISIYRLTYPAIVALWEQGNRVIEAMSKDKSAPWGTGAVVVSGKKGILMPNGLYQQYPGLKLEREGTKFQYVYSSRKGTTKIYGGKLTENICQGLARCIIGEQMLRIAKRYRTVLTVHDAVACIAPEAEAEEAMAYVMECMRHVPDWAQGIPLNCEAGYGKSYGDC